MFCYAKNKNGNIRRPMNMRRSRQFNFDSKVPLEISSRNSSGPQGYYDAKQKYYLNPNKSGNNHQDCDCNCVDDMYTKIFGADNIYKLRRKMERKTQLPLPFTAPIILKKKNRDDEDANKTTKFNKTLLEVKNETFGMKRRQLKKWLRERIFEKEEQDKDLIEHHEKLVDDVQKLVDNMNQKSKKIKDINSNRPKPQMLDPGFYFSFLGQDVPFTDDQNEYQLRKCKRDRRYYNLIAFWKNDTIGFRNKKKSKYLKYVAKDNENMGNYFFKKTPFELNKLSLREYKQSLNDIPYDAVLMESEGYKPDFWFKRRASKRMIGKLRYRRAQRENVQTKMLEQIKQSILN